MKKKKKISLGKRIEELVDLKNKASSNSQKYTELYMTEVVKEAQSTAQRLTDRLNLLNSEGKSEASIIKVVDELFDILFEEHALLDKVESDYTFWNDIHKKFNS